MFHQKSLGLPPLAEPGEVWRRCQSWPWIWASSEGRIASEHESRHRRWCGPPRIISIGIGRQGYRIWGRRRKVANYVSDAWHGPRPKGCIVRHLDGNRTNDRPGNLAWGSYRENREDAVAHGTLPQRLDAPTVIGLLLTMRSRETDAAAAQRIGVRLCTVQDARLGRTWKHVAPCLPRRKAWRALQAQRGPVVPEGEPKARDSD